MKFTLTIDCDNAAFERNPEAEVSRILRTVRDKITDGLVYGSLMDVNGNKVGKFEFETD